MELWNIDSQKAQFEEPELEVAVLLAGKQLKWCITLKDWSLVRLGPFCLM